MKSLGKLGRKLSMQRGEVKEMRDHQPSAQLDELVQASKDMQGMRNCYDGLLAAAAATANSIYEFSESLNVMGNCLLETTAVDSDDESGKVLSVLGNMQLELQKIADTYRSYVVMTITNPTESLLSELRKVEEMKLQCDEKREVYEYMMAQHREKGKLRNGKGESSVAQKLHEAQEEYDEVARLCVFRVKSLKEGQCRSLFTQAARHHAAQLNFFRKGLKALEAVEPSIRNVAEKHRIDCQLSGLHDLESREGEPMSGYESTDDGELSFDYKQKKQGPDDDGSPMEDPVFGRQARVSSYSAPLYPEKSRASERPKEMQPPNPKKFYSYVLPPPVVDTRNPSRSTPVSYSTPFQNPSPEKHVGDDNTSTSASTITRNSSVQLPAPFAGRYSLSQRDNGRSDSNMMKRQSYSGPLPPSKQNSFKIASNSGPIPQPPSRVPVPLNVSRSASPPPISSPIISELHELPRPPIVMFSKNQEISPPNKRVMLTSTCASPLPLPPSAVPQSFSSNHREMAALHVKIHASNTHT